MPDDALNRPGTAGTSDPDRIDRQHPGASDRQIWAVIVEIARCECNRFIVRAPRDLDWRRCLSTRNKQHDRAAWSGDDSTPVGEHHGQSLALSVPISRQCAALVSTSDAEGRFEVSPATERRSRGIDDVDIENRMLVSRLPEDRYCGSIRLRDRAHDRSGAK